MIRSGPVIAAICQYRQGRSAKSGFRPLHRIVLRGRAATGLAALVNSAGPLTPRVRSCDRPANQLPLAQFLVFAYATGQVKRVAVEQLTCQRAVVTVSRRSAVLTSTVASDLFALTMVATHPSGPRTPRLIGLSAAQAAAATQSRHFSVYFDGGVIDRAARTGTVIFQSLPAGLPDNGADRQVNVITAVRRSPPCAAGQLALTYIGGEPATDFGTLLVRDRSRHACALGGPVRVTGLNPAGRRVTSTVRFPFEGAAVLSPSAGPITRPPGGGKPGGFAPGELVGVIGLQAEYRDGPANVK